MTGALSGTFFRFLLMCLGRWRPEPEAVPGETVRLFVGWHFGCGSLVGCVRLQRFLHRSASRDTVRKNVLFSRAGVGRFGLFSAIFGMRISTSDKAGGLVRPRPPALHRLAGGQFGPDGKCLFWQPSLANAKVELAELRFRFGSGMGALFRNRFWASMLGPPL